MWEGGSKERRQPTPTRSRGGLQPGFQALARSFLWLMTAGVCSTQDTARHGCSGLLAELEASVPWQQALGVQGRLPRC